MKKTLLIALLLIPFLGISQTTKPIEGFLGIKFGSSKAVVIAAMKAKGATLFKARSDNDNLAFSNAKLGTREAAAFLVRFVNDKAFEADYIFAPQVEAKVIDDYKDLVADITRVYGAGKAINHYNDPYNDGEGLNDSLTGLAVGKIDLHTTWFDNNKNSVTVSIETNMVVKLQYQDDALTNRAIEKQNAKEKSDF